MSYAAFMRCNDERGAGGEDGRSPLARYNPPRLTREQRRNAANRAVVKKHTDGVDSMGRTICSLKASFYAAIRYFVVKTTNFCLKPSSFSL